VRSRLREVFFFAWSVLDLALIVAATLADGGTRSPFALIFFVPVVFAAMSYPLGSVIGVGGLTLAGYVALAVTVGGSPWGYQALFAVMLACAGAMSAWMAGNQERQRAALMEVSRADPMTGCLNRRGFEERAVAEIEAATRRARQGAVLLLDVDHFKEVNDRHGHAAGDALLRWVVQTLRDSVRLPDAIGRLGGDEFAVLFADIEPGDALETAARLGEALAERAPCSVGMASFPMDGTDLEELMRHADGRLYASRHGRPEHGRTSSNERLSWAATLAHAVDMRLNAQHEHSRAVAECAVSIAQALGWEEDMLGMLRIAAMLHDVGKVTVPDRILCKPGPLTAEEFELMKGHSLAGAELVARIEGLETVVPWIRHSHERYDGSGYPTACGRRRSRWPRGSCSWRTPSTRSRARGPTATRSPSRARARSSGATRGRSSTRRAWRRSWASSRARHPPRPRAPQRWARGPWRSERPAPSAGSTPPRKWRWRLRRRCRRGVVAASAVRAPSPSRRPRCGRARSRA
jgi:diguanylate cyclase (GGDEF)-like protein